MSVFPSCGRRLLQRRGRSRIVTVVRGGVGSWTDADNVDGGMTASARCQFLSTVDGPPRRDTLEGSFNFDGG